MYLLTLNKHWSAHVKRSEIDGNPSLSIDILFDDEAQRTEFVKESLTDGGDGDTVVEFITGEEIEESDSPWPRRLDMVAAKHERTGGPDEQELADIGRSS
jgi:hypothetical protein